MLGVLVFYYILIKMIYVGFGMVFGMIDRVCLEEGEWKKRCRKRNWYFWTVFLVVLF